MARRTHFNPIPISAGGLLILAAALGCSAQHGMPAPTGSTDGGGGGGPAPDGGNPPAPDGGTPPAPDGGGPAPAGKRGVAYGFTSAPDLNAFGGSVSWWYNWSPKPNSAVAAVAGVEFVPMVWGGTFDPTQVEAAIPAGARYLLGFNEPNFGSQSNLTPAAAAALWPKLEAIADKRGLKLVSPALNYCGGNCNETDPFVWLDKFFAACTNCRVDYIAMHWYACSKDALNGYLTHIKSKYSQPIWLTEFSCLDAANITPAQEAQYLQDALDVLEADPAVFRYSWFSGRFTNNPVVNLLGTAPGQLTALGQSYVAHPAH